MAKNRIYASNRRLELVVGAGVTSGSPVAVGKITGVAIADADSNNKTVVDRGGVYDLSVKAIDGAGDSAVAVGDEIYYTAGDTPKLNKKVTGILFGHALEAIVAGATDTVQVALLHG